MDVTVLGATGYTGRLCAAEAVRRGLSLRLAGRRRDALGELAADLGGVPIVEVDVGDDRALRELAEGTRVLLTTVGPYEQLGRPVLDAAIAGGADYLDVTGETGFLSWAYGRHDDAAQAGVTAVPGAGFDGVPGELLALLAADELGQPPEQVRVGYLVKGVRPSPGTVRSALGVVADRGAVSGRWQVPFPEPLGRRGAIAAPLPEEVAVPRSLPGAAAAVYAVVPAAPVAAALTRPLGALAAAAARTPVMGWLDSAAGRLVRGGGSRTRQRTRMAVLAEVEAGGRRAAAWARMTDIYGSTARYAVEIAARLLAGGAPAGVLTPGQLLRDDPAGFLAATGTAWDSLGVSSTPAEGRH